MALRSDQRSVGRRAVVNDVRLLIHHCQPSEDSSSCVALAINWATLFAQLGSCLRGDPLAMVASWTGSTWLASEAAQAHPQVRTEAAFPQRRSALSRLSVAAVPNSLGDAGRVRRGRARICGPVRAVSFGYASSSRTTPPENGALERRGNAGRADGFFPSPSYFRVCPNPRGEASSGGRRCPAAIPPVPRPAGRNPPQSPI